MINKNYLNKFVFIIIIGYFFRLIFGLNYDFWFVDNIQVYLIGLKFYTTGLWPYWGPDVVRSGSSIPGALQGLLVGLPFYLFKIPEAPFIFLNILSIFSLSLFAWYLSKRIPSIPKHIILIWILTLPSFMYYSTVVQNPSYLIFAGILFFIAIFEIFPFYEKKIITENILFFILGFSLFWVYQLHLSWVLLIPYIALSFYFKYKEGKKSTLLIKPMLFFMAGCLICLATLLPTLIQFNQTSIEGIQANASLNFLNIIRIFDIVFNFLSFSTFEVEKFIPENSAQLIQFMTTYFWLIPLVLFLLFTRIVQFIYLIIAFLKNRGRPGWSKVQYFIVFSLSLLWFSFLFTEHFPTSHKFYLMMPISVWYSLHVYQDIFLNKKGRLFANVFLFCGVLFYILTVVICFNTGHSLYSNRVIVEKAINEKEYTFLGTRRESVFEHKHRENIWKSSSINDGIIFSTNVECKNKYFLPQNITTQRVHSGLYSCRIDSIQQFSTGFEKTMDFIGNYSNIKFSMWMLSSKQQTDGVLVVSVQNEKKTIFWEAMPLKNNLEKAGEWQKIYKEINLPVNSFVKGKDKISIYVWNPVKTEELIYIDDIEVGFIKKY